jgi:hypothetical protein
MGNTERSKWKQIPPCLAFDSGKRSADNASLEDRQELPTYQKELNRSPGLLCEHRVTLMHDVRWEVNGKQLRKLHFFRNA